MNCIITGRLTTSITVLAAVTLLASTAMAQVFFTEEFEYADGDLDVVSKGLWPTHAGISGPIQVNGGQAIVTSPSSFDHNRQTGRVAGANDIWYYALNFSVELGDGTAINKDFFIHFKDETLAGFNARLALDDPFDPIDDYSLSILASSELDGQACWECDFRFGEQLICVVRWNNGTGEATLWVNPFDENSTSITDDEPRDSMRAVESVALRQDSGSSSVVTIDTLSVGTDFNSVLAAVSGDLGLPGDVNEDGTTDLQDVVHFVEAISNSCYDRNADVNADGEDDLLDVAPFVALLSGG